MQPVSQLQIRSLMKSTSGCPMYTDFSVFKRAGYSGLNFAFIDGLVHYHTLMDSYENLDHGSLQHDRRLCR